MKNNEQDELNYSSDEEVAPTSNPRGKPSKKQASNSHASTFKDFHLKEELLRGTGEAGFENPSEVQALGIPFITFGEDLLCQAKSGMGKTAVFVLGILDQIKIPGDPLQALVLCNTRELAHQIAKEFDRLGKFLDGLKIMTIYGGVNEQA